MGDFDHLIRGYAFDDGVLDGITEGFSGGDWLHTAGEGNPAQWLVGHLAVARFAVARTLGADAPVEGWEQHFDMGAKPGAASNALDPVDLCGHFHRAGDLLAKALKGLTPGAAAKALDHTLPDGGKTHGDFAHFMHFHESYHLGQIGLLRRSLGKPGLI